MTICGKEAMETLARRYPQLYLDPRNEGAEEACLNAVRRGIMPETEDLLHFHGDSRDRLEILETPAGPVEVLTLYDRADFELFLRIIAYRCGPQEIPKTQGASTLDGIINWPKIREHQEQWLREQREKGIAEPDWEAEFAAFTADRKNYRDLLVVLSAGPYSNVPAEAAGLSEEAWITASYTIRKYHECTHVVCRRLYPEQISAVWDELTADAVGLYAAFGRFEPEREEQFLGIRDGRYTGGRLQNYTEDACDPGKTDRLAEKISAVLQEFKKIIEKKAPEDPFALIPVLESRQKDLWEIENA